MYKGKPKSPEDFKVTPLKIPVQPKAKDKKKKQPVDNKDKMCQ